MSLLDIKKVSLLKYNWRFVGSVNDRNGVGEDYDVVSVGKEGVTQILEDRNPNFGIVTYLVTYGCGKVVRIFNPNYVEYL